MLHRNTLHRTMLSLYYSAIYEYEVVKIEWVAVWEVLNLFQTISKNMYKEFGCYGHLAITRDFFSERTALIDTNVKLVRLSEYCSKEQILSIKLLVVSWTQYCNHTRSLFTRNPVILSTTSILVNLTKRKIH